MKFIIFLSTAVPKPHAYLDPGSGSILIQLLIAAGAGALFAVKIYWNKIKGLFSKEKEESPDFLIDDDDPSEN